MTDPQPVPIPTLRPSKGALLHSRCTRCGDTQSDDLSLAPHSATSILRNARNAGTKGQDGHSSHQGRTRGRHGIPAGKPPVGLSRLRPGRCVPARLSRSLSSPVNLIANTTLPLPCRTMRSARSECSVGFSPPRSAAHSSHILTHSCHQTATEATGTGSTRSRGSVQWRTRTSGPSSRPS